MPSLHPGRPRQPRPAAPPALLLQHVPTRARTPTHTPCGTCHRALSEHTPLSFEQVQMLKLAAFRENHIDVLTAFSLEDQLDGLINLKSVSMCTLDVVVCTDSAL